VLARAQALVEENRELQRQLERARAAGGADLVGQLLDAATQLDGARLVATTVEVADADEARALGDRLRERLGSGVAVLAATMPEKASLFAVVTDDMIGRGVRADQVIRQVAAAAGGKGGGRPHMAQAGVGDPGRLPEALGRVEEIVRGLLAGGAS
jgi:alanyl-tRNA synthetase